MSSNPCSKPQLNREGFALQAHLQNYYNGSSISASTNESRIVEIFARGAELFYCSGAVLYGPKVSQVTLTPIVPAHLFYGQSKAHEEYELVG